MENCHSIQLFLKYGRLVWRLKNLKPIKTSEFQVQLCRYKQAHQKILKSKIWTNSDKVTDSLERLCTYVDLITKDIYFIPDYT